MHHAYMNRYVHVNTGRGEITCTPSSHMHDENILCCILCVSACMYVCIMYVCIFTHVHGIHVWMNADMLFDSLLRNLHMHEYTQEA